MKIAVRSLSIVMLCALSSHASGQNRQTMALAEKRNGTFTIVEIECNAASAEQFCVIGGTRISKLATKPLGATQDASKVCYVETGVSIGSFKNSGGVLVSTEGPEGSTCQTQLISTIDFNGQKYVFRKSSNLKEGDFCRGQDDETNTYTKRDFILAYNDLHCEGLEAIPTLWSP